MTEHNITYGQEGGPDRGRMIATVDGFDGEGEVRWSMADPATIIAEFAGVPKTWEGTGVAARMVVHFFEQAKSKGYKVFPRCGYVAAMFRRYPEWSDLRA